MAGVNTNYFRANGNSPAAPVLAGPVFLKIKITFHFYKKQVIKKSDSVIFGLTSLIILDRKNTLRGARLSDAHTLCLQGILLCKKLSNQQSGSVIFDLLG